MNDFFEKVSKISKAISERGKGSTLGEEQFCQFELFGESVKICWSPLRVYVEGERDFNLEELVEFLYGCEEIIPAVSLMKTMGDKKTMFRWNKAMMEMMDYKNIETAVFECNPCFVETDVPFSSLCMHHMLPYIGSVNIKINYNDKCLGASKLTRIVQEEAKIPDICENLCMRIAKKIQSLVECKRIEVTAKGVHGCIACRGAKNQNPYITKYTLEK